MDFFRRLNLCPFPPLIVASDAGCVRTNNYVEVEKVISCDKKSFTYLTNVGSAEIAACHISL